MKLNIAYPPNGTLKQFEVSEEVLRRVHLNDYHLGSEVDGAIFGDEFKGCTFKLRGGSDKEGFPMVQGVMASSRVSLLVKRGAVGFNSFRGYQGERRRKSLRGCLLSNDISVLNVTVQKIGEQPIEGVTDVSLPRRLGPKRANNIRKLFGLSRDDDVRRYVVRRKVSKEGKKDRYKAPRVQRLITSTVRARRVKKAKVSMEKVRNSASKRREYLQLVGARRCAARQRNSASRHTHRVTTLNTGAIAP